MKTLTLLPFSLFSLPLMLNAQTASEILHKVTAVTEAEQHEQAASYFRRAISLNINRSEMFYWTGIGKGSKISLKLSNELALAYKKNRNYGKASLFYRELSQKDPDNVDYLEAVVEIQVCRGQERDALRMYEDILKLDTNNLAASILLGNHYHLMTE